ncbi:MAG: metallophosphoesterase [Planctomycetota bacterium]
MIWSIGDLHLPGGTGKSMDIFGEAWRDHAARIARAWDATVAAGDVVLVPGDLSWAMRLADVRDDLVWLAARPGRKVLVRGNHDYWWQSAAKVRAVLPPGIFIINNDACLIDGAGFAGTRYWNDPAVAWPGAVAADPEPRAEDPAERERLLAREMHRLELSLAALPAGAAPRVALLHFPPVGADGTPGRAAGLLERYRIDLCVFGHVHGPGHAGTAGLAAGGAACRLVAADQAGFTPVLVWEGPSG